MYSTPGPTPDDVRAMTGVVVLDFGTNSCGYCQAAAPIILAALKSLQAELPLQHVQVEDGPGRKLGRSFRVKLWPTLIVLQDGREVARVVRPTSQAEIVEDLSKAS